MAQQLSGLGLVHQERGELDDAIEVFKKSLDLYIEQDAKYGMANVYCDLGNVHKLRGDFEQAQISWTHAAELFRELESPHEGTVQSWIENLRSL